MNSNAIKPLKYHQLMNDLREQILSGQIKAGDKLPSENQLSAKYSVSRQTVRKAIEILTNEGYVYAQHGKGTFCSEMVRHSGNSHNIAVVTTYLSDYIFPKVIQGIDSVLTSKGYSILLKNTRNSRSEEAKALEELLGKDVDGVIIEPSKSQIYCKHLNLYEKLDQFHIPYVFIQACFSQLSDKPQVLMDDYQGGYLITKHLIELGHKHIVGVFKSDDIQGHNRHKGYVKALQEAGILYDPDNVIWFYTEDRKTHPYESICDMIKNEKQIDAIFCYNDQIAMHIIKAIRSMNKRVPEDISVAGYDNSNMYNVEGLKLTTIAHPQEKLGIMAAEMLLDLLEEKEEAIGKKILIEPELIEGNSCVRR